MRTNTIRAVAASAFAALFVGGCSERDTGGLELAPPNDNPTVFDDDFSSGGDFQAFLGSQLDALEIDTGESYAGTASLRVTVPDPGSYAGGAFTTSLARDFTGYNALTFWAKSSVPSTLDVAGIANDNTGTSLYEANWKDIALTTSWAPYVIPIPLAAKLSNERGLFYFAEDAEGPTGHVIWFDEIRYASVPGITDPRPSMTTRTIGSIVGANVEVVGARTTFDVGMTDQIVDHLPGYFTFLSSDESIVRVDPTGIRIVGAGDAMITAKLGDIDVSGTITLTSTAPPTDAPPAPAHAPADVISLLSGAYSNVTVDKWSADWDSGDVSDLTIGGQPAKVYTNLVFAGVEFITEQIDAATPGMTHFHLDLWVPEGTFFKVKLVDFGPDGMFGADDSEHELTFNAGTTPALATGAWVKLDIPLSDFTGLTSTSHLAQFIISGDVGTAYIANVYFHR